MPFVPNIFRQNYICVENQTIVFVESIIDLLDYSKIKISLNPVEFIKSKEYHSLCDAREFVGDSRAFAET